jgi:hypothetical protein
MCYLDINEPTDAIHIYIKASEDTKMSKQGNAGKRKHITLMIPQKLQHPW